MEHTFVHENAAFHEAVAAVEDDESPDDWSFSPDFSDGLAVQLVLDAVERSDELGEWVTP